MSSRHDNPQLINPTEAKKFKLPEPLDDKDLAEATREIPQKPAKEEEQTIEKKLNKNSFNTHLLENRILELDKKLEKLTSGLKEASLVSESGLEEKLAQMEAYAKNLDTLRAEYSTMVEEASIEGGDFQALLNHIAHREKIHRNVDAHDTETINKILEKWKGYAEAEFRETAVSDTSIDRIAEIRLRRREILEDLTAMSPRSKNSKNAEYSQLKAENSRLIQEEKDLLPPVIVDTESFEKKVQDKIAEMQKNKQQQEQQEKQKLDAAAKEALEKNTNRIIEIKLELGNILKTMTEMPLKSKDARNPEYKKLQEQISSLNKELTVLNASIPPAEKAKIEKRVQDTVMGIRTEERAKQAEVMARENEKREKERLENIKIDQARIKEKERLEKETQKKRETGQDIELLRLFQEKLTLDQKPAGDEADLHVLDQVELSQKINRALAIFPREKRGEIRKIYEDLAKTKDQEERDGMDFYKVLTEIKNPSKKPEYGTPAHRFTTGSTATTRTRGETRTMDTTPKGGIVEDDLEDWYDNTDKETLDKFQKSGLGEKIKDGFDNAKNKYTKGTNRAEAPKRERAQSKEEKAWETVGKLRNELIQMKAGVEKIKFGGIFGAFQNKFIFDGRTPEMTKPGEVILMEEVTDGLTIIDPKPESLTKMIKRLSESKKPKDQEDAKTLQAYEDKYLEVVRASKDLI